MPITPILRYEAFNPETVDAMSEAFAEVRRMLELNNITDEISGVARRVIELAQSGIRTKAALVVRTMQEFEAKPQ